MDKFKKQLASFEVAHFLAAERRQVIAWGVSPRNTDPHCHQAPEGRQDSQRFVSCRPSGALIWWGLFSWGLRPRLLAFVPPGLSNCATSKRANRGTRNSKHPRRGSIYVLVLGTTMIVAVLGLAALSLVRIQRLQSEGGDDMRKAQAYAKVALDMAWYRVQSDSSWRSQLASGTWSTDQAIGDGFYSFTGTDPIDGNLTNSAVHPVVIVGVGKSGNATQKLQLEIGALQPGLRCLEPMVNADNNLVFDGGTVTSDRMVSANHDAEVKNNAQGYTAAEAANQIKTSSGGVWYGATTTTGSWPRQMPTISTLYDYYTLNGTTINYSDLPAWNVNLITNPGAESSVTSILPWYAFECSAAVSILTQKSGLRSFYVSARDSTTDIFAQDVTSKVESGVTYYAEAWGALPTGNTDIRLMLKLVASGSGTTYVTLTDWTDISSYKKVSGSAAVTWTGTLTQAEFYVESNEATESFYIDDVVLQVAGAPSDVKVLHRKVLSPASNPFGTANSKGIYILDCGGGKISIRNSRIVGTLILKNQNEGGSEIAGSLHWAPAVISADPMVTNLPALLSNKRLNLNFTSTALNEGLANANFNPTGTMYNGSQDSDKSDTYPSLISGIVYTEKKIEIANSPTITGVLVGHDDITATNATLTLKYNPLYFNYNAPPGFQATVTNYIVPGSYKQVVN
ncbi:MAG: carbohydrate binding domain-containing protein [Planctomycetia bacterium]|nr:carbohydrate binding domain-containing protein [Planctomycetia bacterium]